MSTKILEQKVQKLSEQVMSLKTLIVSASLGRDPEGEYNKAFVKKVLDAEKVHGKLYEYGGKGSLLKQLKEYKRSKK